MTKQQRLLQRIRTELPQVPLPDDAEIVSYRGPKSEGQHSWWIRTAPEICLCETVTELLQAEVISTVTPEDYRSTGYEIGSGGLSNALR